MKKTGPFDESFIQIMIIGKSQLKTNTKKKTDRIISNALLKKRNSTSSKGMFLIETIGMFPIADMETFCENLK
jgi:hypothetical protein